MKKHSGMRPQDILVLLKIISMKNPEWLNVDIANSLKISQSEVSEALNRCKIARLIDGDKRKIYINSLKEFLIYGLKYVFPAEPGAIVRGMPTAHSAYPIKELVSQGSENFVWPYSKGILRGQSIEPLYYTIPMVVQDDILFYELLAILDTLRIGRAREIKIAIDELAKRLENA
jgi:hypothetical protein